MIVSIGVALAIAVMDGVSRYRKFGFAASHVVDFYVSTNWLALDNGLIRWSYQGGRIPVLERQGWSWRSLDSQPSTTPRRWSVRFDCKAGIVRFFGFEWISLNRSKFPEQVHELSAPIILWELAALATAGCATMMRRSGTKSIGFALMGDADSSNEEQNIHPS